MLSVQTEYLLSKILLSIIDTERKVEMTREILCQHPQFEPYQTFRQLDILDKGQLEVTDFEFLARKNGISASIQDLDILVKNYDTDRNQILTYSEFMELVLTNTNHVQRNLVTQRSGLAHKPLQRDLEQLLTKVIECEINGNKRTEDIKLDLLQRYDFSIVDCFKSINLDLSGYIDAQQIFNFMRKNGNNISDEDIAALFRRFDKDRDSLISYEEFQFVILPSESYQIMTKYSEDKFRKKDSNNLSEYLAYQKDSMYSQRCKEWEAKDQSKQQQDKKYWDNLRNQGYIRFQIEKDSQLKERQQEMQNQFIQEEIQNENEIERQIQRNREYELQIQLQQQMEQIEQLQKEKQDQLTLQKQEDLKEIQKAKQQQQIQKEIIKKHIETDNYIGKSDLFKQKEKQRVEDNIYRNFGTFEQRCIDRYLQGGKGQQNQLARESWTKQQKTIRKKSSSQQLQNQNIRTYQDNQEITAKLVPQRLRFFESEKRPNTTLLYPNTIQSLRQVYKLEDSRKGYGQLAQQVNRQAEKEQEIRLIDYLKKQDDTQIKTIAQTDKLQQQFDKFVWLLRQQLQWEKQLELLRQQLSLKQDFILKDAFQVFDYHDKKHLDQRDIEIALYDLKVKASNEQIKLLFIKFQNKEGCIRYSDFSFIFMPRQSSYSQILENRISKNQANLIKKQGKSIFSQETQGLMRKILTEIIDSEDSIEKSRLQLAQDKSFDVHNLFMNLNKSNYGYFMLTELQEVLSLYRIFPSERECKLLLERYDSDRDGKVTYNEFTNEITPHLK